MQKNVLLCAVGVVLGFAVGFFVANSITRPGAQVASARPASDAAAGPLGPEQAGGPPPPGHPDIGKAGEGEDPPPTPPATPAHAPAPPDKADPTPKDLQAQAQG